MQTVQKQTLMNNEKARGIVKGFGITCVRFLDVDVERDEVLRSHGYGFDKSAIGNFYSKWFDPKWQKKK